jgi:hypothetical protein
MVWVEAGAGWGMNGSRAKARRLLAGQAVTAVVAGHRGRLGRVSTGLAGSAFAARGGRLVVPGGGEVDDGLVRDVVEVLTLFCARRYGRRPAPNRALTAAGCASAASAHLRLSVPGGKMPIRPEGGCVMGSGAKMGRVEAVCRAAQLARRASGGGYG